MLYLTEPTWIWVAAGITIPILIHLAKGRKGKTLRIGSILFIKENIVSQSSSLKIREIILLLLRCLGILLLALLLSKPFWKSSFLSGNKKGWILVEKESTKKSLEKYQHQIDSLLQTGFELHLLENDFPKTRISDIGSHIPDTSIHFLPAYWDLLRKLQEKVPPDLPLFVFTGNKLNRFFGNRPALSLNLQWFITDEPDSLNKWTADVYQTPEDSLRVLTGNSDAKGSWYHPEILHKEVYHQLPLHDQIPVDTATLDIIIFSKAGSPDGEYVQAALEAVQQYTRHKIKIRNINNRNTLVNQADWLFWLSDSSLPARLHPKNLFIYKTGEPVHNYSRIYAVEGNEEPGIPVSRMIYASGKDSSLIYWSDGFGHPLLTVKENESRVYTFSSRFDPSWNDLPWSSSLPFFFLNLLYPEKKSEKDITHDLRRISPAQIMPAKLTVDLNAPEKKYQYADLSHLTWIILFLVFCLERFLSLKKKQSVHV